MAEADSLVGELSLQDLVQALLSGVLDEKSSNLKEALDSLIVASRNSEGRSYLASKNILPSVLQLTQSLLYQSACNEYLILLLKLLRNLCAGEIANQNSFIEQNGVGVVVDVLKLLGNATDVDIVGIRFGLQVLANVSLAGKEHQHAVWHQLFPGDFYWLAKLRSLETCDPLYMVIYVCSDGIPELVQQLSRDEGLPIVTEIVITASIVGFKEDWLKLLLSRICLENDIFPHLFSSLFNEDARSNGNGFSQEQAYLLNVLSTILNERLEELSVPHNFALHVFEIVKRSIEFIDFSSRGKTGLPIGSAEVDVLGYSLSMVRDICAQDGQLKFTGDSGAVDHLLSTGLLEVFLRLLSELELPSTIKKALRQTENQQATPSDHVKVCPYKGFRRDIVAIIGNCAYRRKHVQDMIRDRKWILLLLQQCVADEDNPYLREWGIWCVRNLLEGNAENQEAVAELEIQGSVQTPELAGLGLRVEVDENTKRAKLVNIS